MLFDGKLSRAQIMESLQSLGIVATFCTGVYMAMLALPRALLTSIGTAYCAIFVTNDRFYYYLSMYVFI